MKSFVSIITTPIARSTRFNRDWISRMLRGFEGRFLELGPGNAPLLASLPNDTRHEKCVIELPGAVEHCRKLGYRCLEHDIGKDIWDIDDESMDVIVGCQVLEHIPDVDHVMTECRRVLRPGGKLLISTPNQGSLLNIVLMILTINPPFNMVSDRYYGLGNPLSTIRPSAEAGNSSGHGHLRLFATRAMKDLMRVYGFRVLCSYGGSWGLPLFERFMSRIFPYYGIFTTMLAEKL
jgi:SAM-dependent methyltransferase